MATPSPETASGRRRIRNRQDARRIILDATEALVVEQGYEAFSMRRLAERCGYTAPTIYHYFTDKKGLFDSLLEERLRRMVRSVRRVRRSQDPVERLLTVAQSFLRFGLRNPTHVQLFTALRPDPTDPPESSVEARDLIEAPLLELEQQGRLLVRDVEEAFQCLWITMHGAMSLLITRTDYAWSKDMARTSLAAMLRGLVAPAGRGNGRARGEIS